VKLAEPRRAAELAAAWPERADELGLVTRADLLHLDAHAQLLRDLSHQIAKIHAVFGEEVDGGFAAVETILHLNELHRKAAGANQLAQCVVRLALASAVLVLLGKVAIIGLA